jgi:hypothetical protein
MGYGNEGDDGVSMILSTDSSGDIGKLVDCFNGSNRSRIDNSSSKLVSIKS